MPNWKNEAEYQFKDAKRKERWVWEFLRRNPDYQAAYKATMASTKKQHTSVKKAPGSRRFLWRNLSPIVQGHLWKLKGPIHDPSSNKVPEFRSPLPETPSPDDVVGYFYSSDGDKSSETLAPYTVLVFHLDAPRKPQLREAQKVLEIHQAKWLRSLPKKTREAFLVRRSFTLKQFPTYLRVLDAKAAKAKTTEIVTHIAAYKSVKYKTNAGLDYVAQQRIRNDEVVAHRLVANPWSLLG